MTDQKKSPDSPDIIRSAQSGIVQAMYDLSASMQQGGDAAEGARPVSSVARSSYILLNNLFSDMGDATKIDRLIANVSAALGTEPTDAFVRQILPSLTLGVAGSLDYGDVVGHAPVLYPFSIVVSYRGRLPAGIMTDAGFMSEVAKALPGIGLLPPFSRVIMLPMLIPSDRAARLTAGRCWELARNMREAFYSPNRNDFMMKRIADRAFGKSLTAGGGKNEFGSAVLFGLWQPPPEGIEPDAFRFSDTSSYMPDETRDVLVRRASNALAVPFSKLVPAGTITSINPTWMEGITSAIVSDVLHQSANIARQRGIHPTMNFDDACCAPARTGYNIALKRPEGIIGPIHVSQAAWELAGTHVLSWLAQVTKKPNATTSTPEQFAQFMG